MKSSKISFITISFVSTILLFSGCIESVTKNIPEEVTNAFDDLKYTLEEEFDEVKEFTLDELNRLKEFGIKGIEVIEDIVINEDELIYEISKLEPIDDKTINGVGNYHKIADSLNLFIHILNREIGLDLDILKGSQEEYEKLLKIVTEYTPLVGNYNDIVNAAKLYKNGNLDSKKDFYNAIAGFSLELILIQGAVFYKPAYRLTGVIYKNTGLTRLAFKCPSIVSYLLKSIHWYIRDLMVDKSSEIAKFFINELNFFNTIINSE